MTSSKQAEVLTVAFLTVLVGGLIWFLSATYSVLKLLVSWIYDEWKKYKYKKRKK